MRTQIDLPDELAGERLIGRAEYQALIGVSRATVERWLAMGQRRPTSIELREDQLVPVSDGS